MVTNLLAASVKQGTLSERDSRYVSQENSFPLWRPNIKYRITSVPHWFLPWSI
jgi:hypothetical protein